MVRLPLVFQLPSENPEEPEIKKEFTAVILYHHPIRAYFKGKYDGSVNPPDCGSLDAVTGYGDPGGDCANCIYNEYGTAENNAKACKERRRLYLLREGELFPVMLSLPPSSLKELSRYLMRLLSKGHKSYEVVTKFSLAKGQQRRYCLCESDFPCRKVAYSRRNPPDSKALRADQGTQQQGWV